MLAVLNAIRGIIYVASALFQLSRIFLFFFFVNSITNKKSKWLTEHASVLLVVARLLVVRLIAVRLAVVSTELLSEDERAEWKRRAEATMDYYQRLAGHT